MKKIFLKTAFSLIELIVATVLVAVIILGIVAINNVLSNNNQDYGQKYLVKTATQSLLNNILLNASMGVGSAATDGGGNPIDQAILLGGDAQYGWGDPNSFCIHQGPNNNVGNTNADEWLCYTWTPANYQVSYCTIPYVPGANPRGANSCNIANNTIIGPTFVGTTYIKPAATFTQNGAQVLFSITLTNCLDNTAVSCTAGGLSGDPANNPEIQITGSAFPTHVSSG